MNQSSVVYKNNIDLSIASCLQFPIFKFWINRRKYCHILNGKYFNLNLLIDNINRSLSNHVFLRI
jgi:hypothetical protein